MVQERKKKNYIKYKYLLTVWTVYMGEDSDALFDESRDQYNFYLAILTTSYAIETRKTYQLFMLYKYLFLFLP